LAKTAKTFAAVLELCGGGVVACCQIKLIFFSSISVLF